MAAQVTLPLLLGLVAFSGVSQAQPVVPAPTEPFTPPVQPAVPSTSAPFTLSERWSHYLHRTYGPDRVGFLAAETALDQLLRDPGCWDRSAEAYGKRYGRAFERRFIRNTAELGAGLLTGEDLRYRTLQSGSTPRRIWHAMHSAVTARMPDGTTRPAYTRFFASAVTEMSTTHWTRHPIRTGWAFESVGWSFVDQVQTNLLDEFGPDMRRVARHVRKAALAK
ncbi:MAG TPA: hypothetical protein VMH28_18045 [Candidatus Acidoferrales bacterium]|nr:hypothetical protein [Candidatus Acidoferrales bacterium]